MQMDADKARELLQSGAAVLLLDVPPGTRVGLDHMVRLFRVYTSCISWRIVAPMSDMTAMPLGS